MRKIATATLVALLLLVLVAWPSSAATSVTGKIVALDPGHGGSETGAIFACTGAPTLLEKDINLAVAQVLVLKLQTDGATVVLTRNDDTYVSLDQRVSIANNAHAQALVSIHHNGSSNASADWTETYYSQANDKPLAVAAYNALHSALSPLAGQGAKHSPGFTLTVKPKMPSTLTEAYFVTNATEAGYFCGLSTSQYTSVSRVQTEAAALEQGVLNYFTQISGGGRK